jgi:hypothetical protein
MGRNAIDALSNFYTRIVAALPLLRPSIWLSTQRHGAKVSLWFGGSV